MAVIFGRFRPRETGYWAVQLRRGGAANAVTGRYICHERDVIDARLAAAALADRAGMLGYTFSRIALPVHGWSDSDLPALGASREVTNLFLWSRILDARHVET
jgi:hypothetical protein